MKQPHLLAGYKEIFFPDLAIAVRIVGAIDHFTALAAQNLCLFPVVFLAGLAVDLPLH